MSLKRITLFVENDYDYVVNPSSRRSIFEGKSFIFDSKKKILTNFISLYYFNIIYTVLFSIDNFLFNRE